MGNQPSAPTGAPSLPATITPPPLPPPCDMECQKQKKLVTLKQAMDAIDPEQDPAGYEKARIAYYTTLNGPGWLAQQKQRIAKEEVEPVVSSYQQQYNALKGEQQMQSVFKNMADGLKAQEAADEATNSFLKKQKMIQTDTISTINRNLQLNAPSSSVSGWLSWLIDIVIVILALFVAYKGYTKYFTSPVVPDLTST
jgi:hypothetical protein